MHQLRARAAAAPNRAAAMTDCMVDGALFSVAESVVQMTAVNHPKPLKSRPAAK